MQLRDNGLRFSPITIMLHWIVAALLLSIIVLDLAIAQASEAAAKLEWTRTQNLVGAVLFLVAAYRFWARVTSYHPLPLGAPNPVEVIVSRSVATALALAMVLLPIAAWLAKSAGGEIIALPGGFAIPPLLAPNGAVKHVVDILYEVGATAFLMGLAMHLFGAFKNHFLLKNNVLKRMLGKHVEL